MGYVSTNSISQDEPVPPLWEPIIRGGWRACFAHRSLLWNSEAPKKAAVQQSVKRINPYLLDAPMIVVHPRAYPLSTSVPDVFYGNKPTDGKQFQVSVEQHAEFAADPIASKYLRCYIGAKELLHNLPRWCLWLNDMTATDIAKSP